MYYASINSHKKVQLSWRDDLESAFYVLLHFYCGYLPWLNLKFVSKQQDSELIWLFKEKSPEFILENKISKKFIAFFEYVRNLSFEEKPNYGYLKDLFK